MIWTKWYGQKILTRWRCWTRYRPRQTLYLPSRVIWRQSLALLWCLLESSPANIWQPWSQKARHEKRHVSHSLPDYPGSATIFEQGWVEITATLLFTEKVLGESIRSCFRLMYGCGGLPGVPKHLLWTNQSILLLAVLFLVPEDLTNILLAPRKLILQNALLVSVGKFILTFVFCFTGIVRSTPGLGSVELWGRFVFNLALLGFDWLNNRFGPIHLSKKKLLDLHQESKPGTHKVPCSSNNKRESILSVMWQDVRNSGGLKQRIRFNQCTLLGSQKSPPFGCWTCTVVFWSL